MSKSHPPLRPVGPVLLLDRFAPLQAELIALLRGLAPGDWHRPTACALWSVKDIVAHLLDDDLRRLSFDRDGGAPPGQDGAGDYASLVAWINRMNAQWVAAARRLSPRVLVDLLEVTGPQVVELFRSRDPFAPAHWAVAWAGETESPHWFDVGRDYTERWLHQQQIREAVGAPPLTGRVWLGPVLELFVRAVPFGLRDVVRPPGTAVYVAVTGEAGGDWTVRRMESGWALSAGAAPGAAASVRLSDDTAWRLFSKGLAPDAARERCHIEGDQMLGAAVLGSLAVMA
jgi:uncharacterized protein (TIGR03083 family)